jgi:hypothetical protein
LFFCVEKKHSFTVTHVWVGGYHHWCLRLYFQFSIIFKHPTRISSQKQVI